VKKQFIIPMLLLISSLLFFSCAAQKKAEIKVEKEIQNESVVKQADVADSMREYILKSETLSELQKKSLLSLQQKTILDSRTLSDEINKAKLVLVKKVLQSKVNEREVSILKKTIKKLSKKRMEVESSAFDKARKIIDPLKEVRDREFLYNSFMMRHNYYW
jgi:hypothetical protein